MTGAGTTAVARERRALRLIEEWIELPSGERATRQAALRDEDAALAGLVDRLMAHQGTADAMFPTDAPGLPPETLAHLPERIGPYRIVGRIGDGGMGLVLKGERDDGVFEQVVAIKLIRTSLISAFAQERFLLERQILGRLDSPSIARILDGGSWEGRPYLIMEYVDGEPLAGHVRAFSLTLDQRLALFLKLCDAVQFAHRRLIVHADIKPSNIMITHDGGIKLLDFGIARLVEDGEPAVGESDGPLTRAYASPERQAGVRPNVAGDVYSLGAVLFELLTGHLPETITHTMLRTAPAETVRVATPAWPRPGESARDPLIPAARLKGDLDAIVLRALAADPERRYADVASLVADLDAYRADRAVSARPATWRYLSGKFVRRHHKGLLLSALVAAALIGVTALSVTQWIRADRAQREATARFNDARGAANYLLFELMSELESRPRSLVLRSQVATIAQRYLDRLSQARHAPPEVRLEAASGLWKLAEAQARPGHPNLGLTREADANLRRAEAIALTLRGIRADTLLARIRIDRVRLASNMEMDSRRAEQLLTSTKASVDRAAGYDPRLTRDYAVAVAEVRIYLGRYKQAIAVLRPWLDWQAPETRIDMAVQALLVDEFAEATFYDGDAAAALLPYRRAMALSERAHVRWPADNFLLIRLARARWNVGTTLEELQRPAEALPILAQGLAESDRSVAFDVDDWQAHRMNRIIRAAYAQALGQLRRFDEAVAVLEPMAETARADWMAHRDDPLKTRDYAMALILVGEVQGLAGNRAKSCAVDSLAVRLYARAQRMGAVSKLDFDHNFRLLNDRRRLNC